MTESLYFIGLGENEAERPRFRLPIETICHLYMVLLQQKRFQSSFSSRLPLLFSSQASAIPAFYFIGQLKGKVLVLDFFLISKSLSFYSDFGGFVSGFGALKHYRRPDKNGEHRHRKRFPVIYLSSPPILRFCFLVSYCTFPDAFDNEKLLSVVEMLKQWKAVDIPKYDFRSYKNNISRRVS
ncbi:unnamed protein product [Lactuca saligna]|uniref:Uncharacterized protein n=1 Tax=Lactuca saligna TaxID=75948 RepID=A0AA35Z4B2_LACSI|nr:unnamed protein product [Lactuca saligna]